MSEKLKTASVLAFERKLDPSDALLYYGLWEGRENHTGWNPVRIREKSVRGTISNRLKGEKNQDPLKLNASIESPNLQTIDVATLPEGSDTLKVRFSLRVLSGIGTPSACNSPEYKQRVTEIVQTYMKSYGLSELAYRYAFNLANGRFLWRNRLGAERVEIRIKHIVDGHPRKSWAFDKTDKGCLVPGTDNRSCWMNSSKGAVTNGNGNDPTPPLLAAGDPSDNFIQFTVLSFVLSHSPYIVSG